MGHLQEILSGKAGGRRWTTERGSQDGVPWSGGDGDRLHGQRVNGDRSPACSQEMVGGLWI